MRIPAAGANPGVDQAPRRDIPGTDRYDLSTGWCLTTDDDAYSIHARPAGALAR